MSGIEDLNPSLAGEPIEFDQEENQRSPSSPGEAGTAAGALGR